MPVVASEPEILTIKQVAEYLRVTERTIYRLAAARQVPSFKVGGVWRFSRADLDTWIRHQSAAVPAETAQTKPHKNGSR